jgi:Protein of unknown function (DUF4038)/Putative collagen-binding domain of a collagenase
MAEALHSSAMSRSIVAARAATPRRRGVPLLAAIATLAIVITIVATQLLDAPVAPAMAYRFAMQCRDFTDRTTWAIGVRSPSNKICGPIERLVQGRVDRLTAAATPLAAATNAPAAWPLMQSENKRYLVDQNGAPFLMVGDSPQALIGGISVEDAEYFLSNRKQRGFNTVWVNLLCNNYTGCNADGTTFDGIQPFSTPGNLTTPNETYFARVDKVLSLAAQYGILVILDPIETGGWLGVLKSNSPEVAFEYGQYLGNRYKEYSNIIWMSGNDYQSWTDVDDDTRVLAVAQGIKDVAPAQIHTVELNYRVSSSLDDPRWEPVIQLDAAYTYMPTYAEVLKEYNRPNFLPVFMLEANYEGEYDYMGPQSLRRQEYWAFLSGSTGQLYGNRYTWQFLSDWKNHLDTPGSLQFQYAANFFATRRWFDMVPDQNHVVVTNGYGTFTDSGTVNDSDYLTAARTPDGKLIVAYVPTERTLTVDMAQAAGPVHAQWFDPASGTYSTIAESPLANAGLREFHTPGKNTDGDGDWVLILES